MFNTIGFIGMGNMAQALAAGFIAKGFDRRKIFAYAPNQEKLQSNAEKYGFQAEESLQKLYEDSDALIMACKPYQIEGVLKSAPLRDKALISIAVSWNFEKYRPLLDPSVRFQYVMPNTPAKIGKGIFLFEKTNSLHADEREKILSLFGSVGIIEELSDSLMPAGSAITGCGPAFVDLMIEAYADAAVKYGLARDTAYRLVSATLEGSAALQLATGAHPGVLKDQVCSPGGTTIAGVDALEKHGLRAALISSIDAVMDKVI